MIIKNFKTKNRRWGIIKIFSIFILIFFEGLLNIILLEFLPEYFIAKYKELIIIFFLNILFPTSTKVKINYIKNTTVIKAKSANEAFTTLYSIDIFSI